MRAYAQVWRIPGARLLLTAGVVARLGIGMNYLALLFLVQGETGRYALAGAATAVYAMSGAIVGPILGRLTDRIGPGPVLAVTATLHPLALVGLVWAVGTVPIWWAFGLAAVAGGAFPPLTAAARGAWNTLTSPESGRFAQRGPALALETTLLEIVFTAGPVLVAGFVAVASPDAALIASAVITFAGTLTVARGSALRSWRPHPAGHRTTGLGPLSLPGFPALLWCVSGLGIAFGAFGVAIPAAARDEALGGILMGLWGVGSVVGGVWFGTRKFAMALPRQFGWLLGILGVGMVVMAFTTTNHLLLGAALVIGGAFIAPTLTLENALVAVISPSSMMNEAYTWVMTTAVAASAAGSALAGVISDLRGGVPWVFIMSAGAVLLAAIVAAWPGGPISRAVPATYATEPSAG